MEIIFVSFLWGLLICILLRFVSSVCLASYFPTPPKLGKKKWNVQLMQLSVNICYLQPFLPENLGKSDKEHPELHSIIIRYTISSNNVHSFIALFAIKSMGG